MINVSITRACAEEALQTKKVRLVREIPTDREDCVLSIWADTVIKPASYVTILQTLEGVIWANRNFQSFERFLKELRPNLLCGDNLGRLFREAAPGRMCVVDSQTSLGWIAKYEHLWHEPRQQDGKIVFFCADLEMGRFLRVTITNTYDVEFDDVGPGKKMSRR
jgi:hypothetical protein